MADPITLELMHTHQAFASSRVHERATEIAESLYEKGDARRDELRLDFFEEVLDHMDCLDRLSEDIENDQIEDLLLGRAIQRLLQLERLRRLSDPLGPCVEGHWY